MSILKKVFLRIRINKKNIIKKKKGAELVESILMVGISIALIVVIFYPQIVNLMNTGFSGISNWFQNALNTIGQNI